MLQGNVICHLRKQLVFYLTIKRHESMINAIIVPLKKIIEAMFLFLSILTVNIAAILLNLDSDIVRSGPRLHSTCSKQFSSFIVFLNNKITMC